MLFSSRGCCRMVWICFIFFMEYLVCCPLNIDTLNLIFGKQHNLTRWCASVLVLSGDLSIIKPSGCALEGMSSIINTYDLRFCWRVRLSHVTKSLYLQCLIIPFSFFNVLSSSSRYFRCSLEQKCNSIIKTKQKHKCIPLSPFCSGLFGKHKYVHFYYIV